MGKTLLDLYDYMQKISGIRKPISDFLDNKDNLPCLYYIAPLQNICMIVESGGILPRSMAKDYFDVSSQRVQKRRNRAYPLSNKDGEKFVELHNSVNLLLNPVNQLYKEFWRNAKLRADGEGIWYTTIGILEIDLATLTFDPSYRAFFSSENLALVRPSVHNELYHLEQVDWGNIYFLREGKYTKNGSLEYAEVLVHKDPPSDKANKPIIPFSALRRLILFDDRVRFIAEGIGGFTESSYVRVPAGFDLLKYPLDGELEFLNSFRKIFGKDVERVLIKILARMADLELELETSMLLLYQQNRDPFSNKHGMEHILRVMFWVLALGEYGLRQNMIQDEKLISTALYAAFFHDAAREDDGINTDHGAKAAKQFYEGIQGNFFDNDLLTRCLMAMAVHCEDEEPQDDDIVWRLLKDADALDRGRFGVPKIIGYQPEWSKNSSGCDQKFLRLPFLTNGSSSRDFLWSARRLSVATRFLEWTNAPTKDFVGHMIKIVEILVQDGKVDYIALRTVEELREKCFVPDADVVFDDTKFP
jgi:hypothetical protein